MTDIVHIGVRHRPLGRDPLLELVRAGRGRFRIYLRDPGEVVISDSVDGGLH